MYEGDDVELLGSQKHLTLWVGFNLYAEGTPAEVIAKINKVTDELGQAREIAEGMTADVATT